MLRSRKLDGESHGKPGLLSGSLIYLSSNLINSAIPFALLPILTRYLAPSEYGRVAMFQMLVAGLAAFTGLSTAGAANRKYFDEHATENELRDFISSCVQILAASALVVMAVGYFCGREVGLLIGLDQGWIFWAVIVSAASMAIQIRLGQWQVRKRAGKYGALQISQSIANVFLTVMFVIVLTKGAEGRIAAQVWAVATLAAISLASLKRDQLLAFLVWKPAYLKEALSFGVPLIPHVAGIFLLNWVDRFFVNAKLGLTETGIYMVAVQLAGGLALVFDALNKAYVPWLFERLKNGSVLEHYRIVKYTYAWFCLILVGASSTFVIAPLVLPILAGRAYASAGSVIAWLVLGQAFGGMYLMVTNYIFYTKRTGLLSLVTIVTGVGNVILLVGLVGSMGLTGAGVAFAISMAARFLLTWWVSSRQYPMPWFGLSAAMSKAGHVGIAL